MGCGGEGSLVESSLKKMESYSAHTLASFFAPRAQTLPTPPPPYTRRHEPAEEDQVRVERKSWAGAGGDREAESRESFRSLVFAAAAAPAAHPAHPPATGVSKRGGDLAVCPPGPLVGHMAMWGSGPRQRRAQRGPRGHEGGPRLSLKAAAARPQWSPPHPHIPPIARPGGCMTSVAGRARGARFRRQGACTTPPPFALTRSHPLSHLSQPSQRVRPRARLGRRGRQPPDLDLPPH